MPFSRYRTEPMVDVDGDDMKGNRITLSGESLYFGECVEKSMD